jgi:cytochrome c peroxidase
MPGVQKDRFSNRKPQTYRYTAFSPYGPYFDTNLGVWIGGTFWDGRTVDLQGQAQQPPIDANEMANLSSNGIQDPVQGGFSALLVEKLQHRPYTKMILEVFGPNVFDELTPQQIYINVFARGVAAVQGSGDVCPFNSKWDASKFGTPPQNLYTLSESEERGRILYGSGPNPTNNPRFGGAQCFACHDSTGLAGGTPGQEAVNVPILTRGKNTFTMYCFANIGVPKNANNHYYLNTDAVTNPFGFNPDGFNYIDFGLAANPNPSPKMNLCGVLLNGGGTVFNVPGPTNGFNITQFLGLFKVPTTRNVDLRPNKDDFVKAYMHNGVFTSLEEVVHFYNKRNIAVNAQGQEFVFDLRFPQTIPPGYTRLFPPPEVLDNVQNVEGRTPANAGPDVANNGQVGNLQLTPQEEADVVAFLKILSDFFTAPNPVPNPVLNPCGTP